MFQPPACNNGGCRTCRHCCRRSWWSNRFCPSPNGSSSGAWSTVERFHCQSTSMYASFYAIPTIASPMRRRCFSTTDFLALRLLPPALLFNHCLPPKLLFNLLIILPPCFLALAAAAALLLFQFHPCFSSIITIAALPPPQFSVYASLCYCCSFLLRPTILLLNCLLFA